MHNGDENTYFGFSGADTYVLATGGTTALTVNSSQAATFAGDVQAAGLYVGSTNTSYDFYNNGTSYLNGATIIDDTLTVQNHLTLTTPAGASQTGYALKLNKTNSSSQVQVGAEIMAAAYTSNTNGGNLIFKTANSSAVATTALTIDGAQNATFAGTITSGNITTTGTITLPSSNTLTGSSGKVAFNGRVSGSTPTGTTDFTTKAYVDLQISNLVDSSPDALNTLNELAAALNDDASFSTTVTNSIAAKLPLAGGTMTGNIAHASDFTIDVGGDIILDADGAEVILADGGTQFANLKHNLGDFEIKSLVQDKDIKFIGNDNNSDVTALSLDMSDAGAAYFNSWIYTSGGGIGRDAHNVIDFTTDNSILFRTNNANRLRLDQSQFYPVTSDGVALGSGTNMFSDLFLASGAVVNFNNGDVTMTHSSNQLEVNGGNFVVQSNIECNDLDIGGTATGDGSGLTDLNGSQITTGTVAAARVATLNQNTTGSSGSCTGNAATATEATIITATANNSTNETVYPTFVDGATGTQGIETDTGFTYNPSSGTLTTSVLNVASGITHDGDINNKIVFTTDTQTFSCDGNEGFVLRGDAVIDAPLAELSGAGAGNQLNIGLLMKGTTNGNPIKLKMQAPNNSASVTGAGILSYEPDADEFNIGQSTTHGNMAISIDGDDLVTLTNAVTLSGGFVLDGNTITGVDDSGEFTNDDAHIMTSAGIEDKILGYGYTTNTGDATLSGTQTFSGAKTFSAAVTVSNSTASTSKTTGAVKVTGGVGIQGALNVGADVTAFASSDRRYKDNLQAITNPIDKVKSLTGYTFTWNDKHEQFNGNNDIGVVAQEVEKVLPEIVDTRDNGYKAVKYEKMVALLIEAVKDQQKQIDELKEMRCGCSR